MAKALAAGGRFELPLRLDIGRIFSGLVGSSEQNLRTAIATAEAVAPCVLWVDEIEKGFSNTTGQGDSGTTARVFGTLMSVEPAIGALSGLAILGERLSLFQWGAIAAVVTASLGAAMTMAPRAASPAPD